MGKKLSEDEIKWILSVDSAQAQQEIHKLNKANKDLNTTNKAYKKTMQDLVGQGKKNSQEYRNLQKAVKENDASIAKNRKTMQALTDTMDTSQLTMAQLRKRASELKRQLDQTSQGTHPEQYAALNRQLTATRNRMDELNTSGQKIKNTFSAMNVAKAGLIAMIALFIRELKGAISKLKDFQAANSTLAAILGTTRNKIRELTEDAKRLGGITSFTASQVTSLQTALAKLGFNKTEILDSTEDVLAFSEALEADLGESAELAGSALRMFGLESKEMNRVVSVLGVSTTKSAMDFSYLKASLSTVGPVAKSFGFTIEDTVAMLGTLANSGFDASSAATATRNILLNLADSSGALAKALGGPISSFDELIPALTLLNEHGVDLATTLELTDKRSVAAFNTFLTGTQAATDLRDAVTDCGDALKAMQKEKLDNLDGSIKLLSSAWESLLHQFSSVLDIIRSIVNTTTSLIQVIEKLVEWIKKYAVQIKTLLVVIGTYITLQKITNFLKRQYSVITGQAIATTKAEIVILKSWNKLVTLKNTLIGILTGKIKLAAAAQGIWNAVMAVNPLILLASAVAGVVSYLTIFRTKTQESAEAQRELADAVDDTTAAMERMDKIRLKSKHRDTLNERQLQQLRRDSEEAIEIEENRLAQSLALLKENEEKKAKLLEEKKKENKEKGYFDFVSEERARQSGITFERSDTFELDMDTNHLQQQIEQSTERLKELKEIVESIPKKDFTIDLGNDKSDMNAVRLKNLETTHKQELQEIQRAGQEKQQSETEINQAILSAENDYYQKRIRLLQLFAQTEKKADKKADYEKEIIDLKGKLYQNEISQEKQKITAIEKLRTDDLAKEEATNKAQQITLTKQLADKQITREQYEMLSTTLASQSADRRWEIEKLYQDSILNLEITNGQLKKEAIEKANKAVLDAEQKAVNARASMQTKLDDLLKDFKNQFKLTTVDEDLQMQLKVLEASYQARKELAKQHNLDITELDDAYRRAKENLVRESEKRINQIREQYGLLSQKEQYELELQQLQEHLDAKLLSEEEYEKAVQNLKRDSFQKQFDYYLNLFSNAIQALQQAEMDAVDARYDTEIEAAKGNADEVERLEHEKAEKKLEIQKKYADINFAIRCSEIISSTAAAIMQAYAQLGPIAGAIAGALMGVTGAAQLASAVAERNKVKNMILSGKKSSTSTGKRVVVGKQDGGRIDVVRAQDGKEYPGAKYDPDARGFIDKPTVLVGDGPTGQSKEWVASNAAVSNPTVAPFLQLLDAHQRAGDIATIDMNQILRQRMAAGYVKGGSISNAPGTISPVTETPNTPAGNMPDNKRLIAVLEKLEKDGVQAWVLLSELEKTQKLSDKSKKIGSK